MDGASSSNIESSTTNNGTMYRDFEDVGYYIGDTGRFSLSDAKRVKNIYPLVYSNANLTLSQYTAQKGKGSRKEISDFNDNILDNLRSLYDMLKDETYIPGEYRIKTIYEPKERVISIAPFFPDRIIHHCIINVMDEFWSHLYIGNTYACIKGRGTHKCMLDVHKSLVVDKKGTKFCLKIDIRKFFDNVDHAALKKILRYTIADEQLLRLLDKIIDSNGKEKGLPIGNFTSQYLANIYLTYFDHWMKEDMGVKHYFRYMDDIVVLDAKKERLHYLLDMMGLYLATELKIEIKPNWQIFPVDDRGIDYVGFKQTHYGILLRKSILTRFYKKLAKIQKLYKIKNENEFKHIFPSEYGWIIRCDDVHSNFIINNCIDNGNKCIDYRSFGRK